MLEQMFPHYMRVSLHPSLQILPKFLETAAAENLTYPFHLIELQVISPKITPQLYPTLYVIKDLVLKVVIPHYLRDFVTPYMQILPKYLETTTADNLRWAVHLVELQVTGPIIVLSTILRYMSLKTWC